MKFLCDAQPHAQAAPDLLSVLQLCLRANWSAAAISGFLAAKVALTAAQLTPLAHAAIAVRYTKMNNFQGWVKAIGVLLEDGYYTIARGNYYMLDSGTEEVQLFLRLNGVRQVDLDFVVHVHRRAERAAVGSPSASKFHVKPERGNKSTPRVYEESIPEVIKSAYRGHV